MFLKKKVSLGNFLKKGIDFKDGDVGIILDGGLEVEGEFGIQYVFSVRFGEKEGRVAFNQTSINNLIDGYGEDTARWIGKKIKVVMIRQNVQGKIKPVYYFLHPESLFDEENGIWYIPTSKNNNDETIIDFDEVVNEDF